VIRAIDETEPEYALHVGLWLELNGRLGVDSSGDRHWGKGGWIGIWQTKFEGEAGCLMYEALSIFWPHAKIEARDRVVEI
jgi:hypothetical protein